MGYGGKWRERERARELRAKAWTLQDIATELGVAKASVSLWVRDVEFTPNPRRRTRAPRPSSLHLRRLAEIERLDDEGVAIVGKMTDRELLLVGAVFTSVRASSATASSAWPTPTRRSSGAS